MMRRRSVVRIGHEGFATRWDDACSPVRLPSADFDIGLSNHLAPLLGFGGDESPEIGRRARKRRRTQIGEPRFDPGFGKNSVYLLVQLVDDVGRCVLWCGNPKPITRLEAR